MKIKLLQDNRGTWFIKIDHAKKRRNFSLETKDSELAKRLFEAVSYEVSLVNLYTKIMGDLRSIRNEMEKSLLKIRSIIDIKSLISENNYRTEADIERIVFKNLWMLGLTPVGKQIKVGEGSKFSRGCIVDILAVEEGKDRKIAIEIKRTIKESHLGQCLRYLDVPEIDKVYIIGGSIDNSIDVFKSFKFHIYTLDFGEENIFKPYLREANEA